LPAAALRWRHFHFDAKPSSMQPSLEPVVEHPIVPAAFGEFHRRARIWAHLLSGSTVAGFSLVDRVLEM